MRISLITEGASEYASLPKITEQLRSRTGNVFSKPLKVSVPPDAQPAVIARECKSRVLIARTTQAADVIFVLLDREQQASTAGAVAAAIQLALARACGGGDDIHVIVKDRMYENWLLADLDSLRAQPGRFAVTPALVRAIEPNRADRADGLALIKQAVKGNYDKVPDSIKIMERLDVRSAAQHSRSFRHFLHLAGDPAYASQCRIP